jgi:hypothetical protein
MKTRELPRVALVMPHYGGVEPGAAVALCNAPCHPDPAQAKGIVARTSFSGSSLLCQTFNRLLAQCLDWRDEGHITHMAMLHADIVPGMFCWVDVLLKELQENNLDMVSAVVPIKEPTHTNTSTAIGSVSDPWQIKRYVTTKSFFQTVTTFTGNNFCLNGEVLLVNTGCWVADLRLPFWDTFAFQIHDRIITQDGQRTVQTRPEDWELSRAMHAAGIKYGATWALPVTHYGNGSWTNRPQR